MMECNSSQLLVDEDDMAERMLTISNPIVYRLTTDGKQRPAQLLEHRNQLIATVAGDGSPAAGHGYPSPSLSFSYFLQTRHEKVVINCKDAAKTLTDYSRVDVDVYVSPLCYDYKQETPSVSFKHRPKNFHIKVLVPGNLPKPPDDRPPYGLGVEVSLESLSLRHHSSPSPLRRSVRCSSAATAATTTTASPTKDHHALSPANSKLPSAANSPKKAPAKQAMANSPDTKLSTRGQKRTSMGALNEVASSKRKCSNLVGN